MNQLKNSFMYQQNNQDTSSEDVRNYATQGDVINILFALEYGSVISERDFHLLDTLFDKVRILSKNNLYPTEQTIRSLAKSERFIRSYGESIAFILLDLANALLARNNDYISPHLLNRILLGCKFELALIATKTKAIKKSI